MSTEHSEPVLLGIVPGITLVVLHKLWVSASFLAASPHIAEELRSRNPSLQPNNKLLGICSHGVEYQSEDDDGHNTQRPASERSREQNIANFIYPFSSIAVFFQATTVRELKQHVHAKDPSLQPHLQRLTFQGLGKHL